ncbi:hypothetical protein EC988_005124 [Linderina pennispora]|nr:hypothetical protein EC988_005124 [Linderina pennispora]
MIVDQIFSDVDVAKLLQNSISECSQGLVSQPLGGVFDGSVDFAVSMRKNAECAQSVSGGSSVLNENGNLEEDEEEMDEDEDNICDDDDEDEDDDDDEDDEDDNDEGNDNGAGEEEAALPAASQALQAAPANYPVAASSEIGPKTRRQDIIQTLQGLNIITDQAIFDQPASLATSLAIHTQPVHAEYPQQLYTPGGAFHGIASMSSAGQPNIAAHFDFNSLTANPGGFMMDTSSLILPGNSNGRSRGFESDLAFALQNGKVF